MSKALPSKKILNQLLVYEESTGELYWKHRPEEMFATKRAYSTWNSRYAGQVAFSAVSAAGYRVGAIGNTGYRASRVIYMLVHNIDPEQVDHIDGDRLNNRIHNLRDVTGQINQRNMKKASNNTSGQTGVTWDAAKEMWSARINVEGKCVNLGRFTSYDDAVSSRKNAELTYNFHKNHGR